VERLGLDENFIDVTRMVDDKKKSATANQGSVDFMDQFRPKFSAKIFGRNISKLKILI
jgi:hypothetical protein